METILVIVEASGVAERAVSLAADLAAGLGARLIAVSVADGAVAEADGIRVVQPDSYHVQDRFRLAGR